MWEAFLKRISDTDEARIRDALEWVNDQLKDSLSTGQERYGLSAQSIARILFFMAYAITDEERTKKGSSKKLNTPQWKALAADVNKFTESQTKPLADTCCEIFDDDNVPGFATLSTRKNGSGVPLFYSTLLLYLIHAREHSKLSLGYLDMMIPRDDRVALARSIKVISDKMRFGVPAESQQKVTEISQRFLVDEEYQAKLDKFSQKYRVPNPQKSTTRAFQLIVYRPMRRDADQIIKTFVAVYDQVDEFMRSTGLTYSHFYKPPKETGQERFSRGKVLPLHDAVYLLGGQRPHIERQASFPYQSLKVMAIRWNDIGKDHTVFPMLVMTSSYDGKIMISRAAARLTPIDYSDDYFKDTGPTFLTTNQLAEALERDSEIEKSWIDANSNMSDEEKQRARSEFPLTGEEVNFNAIANDLAYYANNDPHKDSGWAVPQGFMKGTESLSTDSLRGKIAHATGENSNRPFKNERGEVFNIWDHCRFGPFRIE